ncbi:hypothetical protein [Zhengella mangrovi]|uniref:hypothetical protein n=1 Tax=Zhengella mangrovi TaxID=1982044 RepID=UPI0010560E5C|nr:hypothetical protein [Zhengella mangrovi]
MATALSIIEISIEYMPARRKGLRMDEDFLDALNNLGLEEFESMRTTSVALGNKIDLDAFGSFGSMPDERSDNPADDEFETSGPSAKVRARSRKDRPACFKVPKLYDREAPDCGKCIGRSECHYVYGSVSINPASAERLGIEARDMPAPEHRIPLSLIRRFYVDQFRLSQNRTRKRNRSVKAAKRAADKSDPRVAINVEAERRHKRLTLRQRAYGKGKRMEQLVGRETEIVTFWKAIQIARMENPKATDRDIATQYENMTGISLTKDQARSKRLLVERLEAPGEAWAPVAVPPS